MLGRGAVGFGSVWSVVFSFGDRVRYSGRRCFEFGGLESKDFFFSEFFERLLGVVGLSYSCS